MASTTITFRVDDAEHAELVVRAEREKVSLSDYIRVRLGLRGQGSQGDADVQARPPVRGAGGAAGGSRAAPAGARGRHRSKASRLA